MSILSRRAFKDHWGVLPAFPGRVLPVDIPIARRCAQFHVPDRQAERDAFIAATALVHDMTLVTRNVREFEAAGGKDHRSVGTAACERVTRMPVWRTGE